MAHNRDLLIAEAAASDEERAASEGSAASGASLARHYRPCRFDHVIGQDVAVRILSNVFTGERTPRAFILCGPHGTGKTTLARLIARVFECSGRGKDSPEPCGACDSCRAIGDERHPDILEIDAASHTSVDHVREITEAVGYRPILSNYKIYIIDEVHMLSRPAFNALLKTLEEPPDHTVFLFATTEIEKVPVTILSRCQRLELARVAPDVLEGHILDIAAREKAEIDDKAARQIAHSSAGSVRDALSLFEAAMIHAGDDPIDEAVIREMTGRADERAILALCEGLLKGDVEGSVEGFGALCAKGAQPVRILDDLLAVLHRRCLEVIRQESATAPIAALQRMWQILFKGVGEAKRAGDAQQAAEMALIRAAYGARLPDLDALIEAVRLRSGGGGSSPPPPVIDDSSPAAEPSAEPTAARAKPRRGEDSPPDRPVPSASPRGGEARHPLVETFLESFPQAQRIGKDSG